MQVFFSRALLTPTIRLFEGERQVLTLAPQSTSSVRLSRTLQPGTQYRIEVGAFRDDFDNDIAPVTSTFTTGAGSDFSAFQFVSASPANGAAGIAGDTPWQLTFNKPLSPIVFFDFGPSSSRSVPYRYSTSVTGKELDIVPSPVWPAASTIQLTIFTNTRFGRRPSNSP